MIGWELEFSVAGLINLLVGAGIGAAVTVVVGRRSTGKIRADLHENLDALVTVARGLEEMARSGKLKFKYDKKGRLVGIFVHLSGTSPGGSSDHATVSAERNDEQRNKRDRPQGEAKDE